MMDKQHIPTLTHAERRMRWQEIANFVHQGGTVHDATREYEVSTNTVYNACRHHGIIPAPCSPQSSKVGSFHVLSEVIKSTKMGAKQACYATVAKSLGVSRQYVCSCMQRAAAAGLIRQINSISSNRLRLPQGPGS